METRPQGRASIRSLNNMDVQIDPINLLALEIVTGAKTVDQINSFADLCALEETIKEAMFKADEQPFFDFNVDKEMKDTLNNRFSDILMDIRLRIYKIAN